MTLRPKSVDSPMDPSSSSVGYSAARGVEETPSAAAKKRGRFPRIGTPEFHNLCSWIDATSSSSSSRRRDCVMLVQPCPACNEGVSSWFAEIGYTFVYAVQAGCGIVLNYRPGVNVTEVFQSPAASARYFSGIEWTNGEYHCKVSDGCFRVGLRDEGSLAMLEERIFARPMQQDAGGDDEIPSSRNETHLIVVPANRFAFKPNYLTDEKRKAIYKLESTLPNFLWETSMACSFGTVLELSPTARKFVPALDAILPSLWDKDTFVIAIYIRTGNTDVMAKAEKDAKEGKTVENTAASYRDAKSLGYQNMMDCALEMEHHQVALSGGGEYSRSAWLVITDSPELGKAVSTSYGGTKDRDVFTTAARGIQTRPNRNPKTVDFAEAAIDWFLLGESDAIVTSPGNTFGATAALRTARPLYYVQGFRGCKLQHLLPDKNESVADSVFGYSLLESYPASASQTKTKGKEFTS